MEQLQTAIEFLKARLEDAPVDDFEIYARSVKRLEVESKDCQLESFDRAHEMGVSLRVVKDGRIGMSSSTDLSTDSVGTVLTSAVASMEEVDASSETHFPLPRLEVSPLAERPGEPLCDISEQDKIDVAIAMDKAVLGAHPKIARARRPRYREESTYITVVNSRGIEESAERNLIFCEVQAVAEEAGKAESAGESVHFIRFEDLNHEDVGRRAAVRAAEMLGGTSCDTGRYKVYFEPRAAAAMLRVLMPSFFAENVQRNKSRLAGKLGDHVLSPLVTVVDDGLLPGGAGSFLFDAEGVWHQRTVVVDHGKVKGWLYDGASAMRDGLGSTGNAARKSVHVSPQTDITNSYIKEGSKDPADLIESCEGGLWVNDLMGLHMANTISGDFSLGATGFLIERGQKARPIRGIVLAGNLIDFFNSVDGVANNVEFFGRYGAPSITVPNMQVNGEG